MGIAQTDIKTKRCKVCTAEFAPKNTMQKVCSPECGLSLKRTQDEMKRRKHARKKLREDRERLMTPQQKKARAMKSAQRAFNAWVRDRDYGRACISCGEHWPEVEGLTGSRWDCGHFLSVGSHPELRFEPENAHRQCVECNQHKSGNHGKYRVGLIQRIGMARVLWLEGPHDPKNYTEDDLKEIAADYRRRLREIRKLRG